LQKKCPKNDAKSRVDADDDLTVKKTAVDSPPGEFCSCHTITGHI